MRTTCPKPCSVLGVDVGSKRIGIAGCDPLGITITQLPAICRGNFSTDLKTFKNHCSIRLVKGLIVGIPLDSTGLPTKQSIKCQKYGEKLAQALQLPLALINEHSTSWEAGEVYNLKGDRSGRLDSAAAALFIEQWLREGPELKPV